ncbi:hypothetical protein Bca52824_029125 [Brassica carinata]|uniref:Uncharacterized protein n=1 Tax=Brassica carinata TaxID=52824 RepID=A0A8X7VDE5_BRACI|nr:hypothetical protein Bca52824_029125 [Brassica carinata]
MAEKDEELSLFLEMRRRQKEQDSLLVNNPHEFETPLAKPTVSQIKPMPTPSKTHAVSPAASPTNKVTRKATLSNKRQAWRSSSPRSNAHHQEEGHRCTLVVALFLLLTVDTPKPMTMINMRKLAPPRLDEKGSPHGNLSAKSFITR